MITEIIFRQQEFQYHGIREFTNEVGLKKAPAGWCGPTDEDDLIVLREKIRDIVFKKSDEYRNSNNVKISDYDFVRKFCSIPEDTYKKTINGRCKLSRNFIAKFVVGLSLGVDRANALLVAHSGEMNLTNDFDFILYHALVDEDDIDYFIDEVHRYLKINLNKERI